MLDGLYTIGGYFLFILLPLMVILGAHLAFAHYVVDRRGGTHPVRWLASLSGAMSVVWLIVVYPLGWLEAMGASDAGSGLPTRPYEALRGFFIFTRTVGLPYALCDVLPGIAVLLPPALCWIGGLGIVAVGLFLLSLLTLLPQQWRRKALLSAWVGLAVGISLYSWQGGNLGEVLPRARSVPLYPRAQQVEYSTAGVGPPGTLRILFRTNTTPQMVQMFYRDALLANGWQRRSEADLWEFTRPAEEGDPRSIAVVATTPTAGRATQVELTIKGKP